MLYSTVAKVILGIVYSFVINVLHLSGYLKTIVATIMISLFK